jgi:hypothetical protein
MNFDIDKYRYGWHIDGRRYRQETEMTEIQLTHFSFGGDSMESSRFYEVALREARVATDAHAGESAAPSPHRGIVERLGLRARWRTFAFAGGSPASVEACACTA